MAVVPITMNFTADTDAEAQRMYAVAVTSLCGSYGFDEEPLPDVATVTVADITPAMIAFARARISAYIDDVVTGHVGRVGDEQKAAYVVENNVDVVMI